MRKFIIILFLNSLLSFNNKNAWLEDTEKILTD